MSYFGGIWDTINSVLQNFGITGDSAIAVSRAFAAPTLANIRAVNDAFEAEGTSAPPELMDQLWQRYYSSIAQNPAAVSGGITQFLSGAMPWLIGGGILFFVLSKKRR